MADPMPISTPPATAIDSITIDTKTEQTQNIIQIVIQLITAIMKCVKPPTVSEPAVVKTVP